MNYIDYIESALIYIELNLKSDFGLSDLAKVAGYSEYHFLRIFKEVTSLTPADYIRKRRLSEIAREIERSIRPISDIAFEYGFNSKENFTRAFKAEHHILPTEYKKVGNSLKLYERFQIETSMFEVIPQILTIQDFTLVGYWSDEEYIPNFWNKYNCRKLSKQLSGTNVCADYGVSVRDVNTNKLDYFIGIRENEVKNYSLEARKLNVPGDLYAVFSTPPTSHFNFVNMIHRTWNYILNSWIPQNNYKYTVKCGVQFETYVEESYKFSEDIYIPVEEK